MIHIEQYDNYRKFLKDFYEDAKKTSSYFSYRYFCNKSGINSPTFYKSVVNGDRNLTPKTIVSFIKGLDLNPKDAKFFTALVHFTQAKTYQDKQAYLDQMRGLLPKIKEKVLPIDYHAYYSHWYNIAVRELACLLDWQDDYLLLAKAVFPPIKKREAQQAVKLLIKLGMLKKLKNGRYIQSDQHISSQAEISSLAIRNVNKQLSEMGNQALDTVPPSKRDISSITLGLSEKSYALLKDEIQHFMERVRLIVNYEEKADKVYNINVHMFPLSKFDSDSK